MEAAFSTQCEGLLLPAVSICVQEKMGEINFRFTTFLFTYLLQ